MRSQARMVLPSTPRRAARPGPSRSAALPRVPPSATRPNTTPASSTRPRHELLQRRHSARPTGTRHDRRDRPPLGQGAVPHVGVRRDAAEGGPAADPDRGGGGRRWRRRRRRSRPAQPIPDVPPRGRAPVRRPRRGQRCVERAVVPRQARGGRRRAAAGLDVPVGRGGGEEAHAAGCAHRPPARPGRPGGAFRGHRRPQLELDARALRGVAAPPRLGRVQLGGRGADGVDEHVRGVYAAAAAATTNYYCCWAALLLRLLRLHSCGRATTTPTPLLLRS